MPLWQGVASLLSGGGRSLGSPRGLHWQQRVGGCLTLLGGDGSSGSPCGLHQHCSGSDLITPWVMVKVLTLPRLPLTLPQWGTERCLITAMRSGSSVSPHGLQWYLGEGTLKSLGSLLGLLWHHPSSREGDRGALLQPRVGISNPPNLAFAGMGGSV